jgi:dTDP-glucose 4,6-dehydratase
LATKNLLRGKKIRLHNNGTPVRNWLHADDTAEAVMTIINSGEVNEIYNVAGGFEQTNLETVKKIIKSYYNEEEDHRKYVDLSFSRQGQDVRYALSDKKLRELGWAPKKFFNDEIGHIVRFYKDNFIW